MRSQAKGVVFFLFHVDPVRDEVGVEVVAAEQKGMIGLERFDRAAERIGDARALREVDWRFESRDEPLEAVRGRIGDAGERWRVFQNSADEKEGHVAQAGVTVAGKERFVAVTN